MYTKHTFVLTWTWWIFEILWSYICATTNIACSGTIPLTFCVRQVTTVMTGLWQPSIHIVFWSIKVVFFYHCETDFIKRWNVRPLIGNVNMDTFQLNDSMDEQGHNWRLGKKNVFLPKLFSSFSVIPVRRYFYIRFFASF